MTSEVAAGISRSPEQPVFVTADGRRRSSVKWLGRAAAILCAAWIGAVGAGVVGFAKLPAMPLHLATVHALARHIDRDSRTIPVAAHRSHRHERSAT